MRGLALVLTLILAACATTPEEAPKERAEIDKMASNTLAKLYSVQPSAKSAVDSGAGYAVFDNFGMKIFVAGSGSGKGVAVDRKTGKRTYMRMGEIQAGLGVGAKTFQVVFVFDTQDKLASFVDSGWEFGTQATAAATTGEKGGAMQGALPVAPGIWMYQLTDKGLALEATAKGTKYWKDSDLN